MNLAQMAEEQTNPIRFRKFYQAINYYLLCNPARQKYPNLFELESRPKPSYEQFSGLHPHDIWAQVSFAIQRGLDACDYRAALIFNRWWLKIDEGVRPSMAEVAVDLHMSKSRCYDLLHKAEDAIQDELAMRGLMDPRSEKIDA